MRPFRFAITATAATSAIEWRAKARRIEELGYSTLLITDHLTAQLAPLPALVAAADATTTLRLGTFVLANDYRNPVMLAKEAATLDVLSSGRLDLGIGAGWATADYEMLGIAYDPPAKRVERLREAVVLLKRLWTEDRVEHSGRHYTVRSAAVLPKTIQKPHPPLMIGGGGPVVLRLAAKHADIVAFAPQVDQDGKGRLTHLSAGATDDKVRVVREAAGDRFDRLELNAIVFDAGVADDPSSLLAHAATRFKGAVAGIIGSPYFLYGSLADQRRQLLAQRERFGISYYALPEKVMEAFAPLARELSAL